MAQFGNQSSASSGERVVNKTLDKPVNPAIMSGLKMYAGQIDIDNGQTATFTLTCKSIVSVITQTNAGTALAATEMNSDGDTGTVTISKATDGAVNYMILVSETESVNYIDGSTGNVTISENGTIG